MCHCGDVKWCSIASLGFDFCDIRILNQAQLYNWSSYNRKLRGGTKKEYTYWLITTTGEKKKTKKKKRNLPNL